MKFLLFRLSLVVFVFLFAQTSFAYDDWDWELLTNREESYFKEYKIDMSFNLIYVGSVEMLKEKWLEKYKKPLLLGQFCAAVIVKDGLKQRLDIWIQVKTSKGLVYPSPKCTWHEINHSLKTLFKVYIVDPDLRIK